jgi:hypothetical protein
MKPTVLLLVLLGAAWQAQAQSNNAPPPSAKRDGYYQPGFSGGGIRGRFVALADGELLTPAEVAEINSDPAAPPQRQRGFQPGGTKPEMPILQPKERKVSSPFALHLALPPESAPDSFRAYYGPNKVDITPRLVAHASMEGNVFRMDKAQLPPGRHVLLFEVKTPQGPVTSQLNFEVQ